MHLVKFLLHLTNVNSECCIIFLSMCVHAQSLHLCLTLYDPVDCSPPGLSVYGIFQARILEWVAIPSREDLPDLRIKPVSPVSLAFQADSLLLSSGEAPYFCVCVL